MSDTGYRNALQGPEQTLFSHKRRLYDLHYYRGLSWRKIAEMEEYQGVSFTSLNRIAQGVEPGKKVRRLLNLPPVSTVIAIGGREIPPGAQVISAQLCECGQYFIANSPNRKRCFICSPYKGKERIK